MSGGWGFQREASVYPKPTTESFALSKRFASWIVVRSKPCREAYAAFNVRRQGVMCYLPVWFDKKRHQRVALFPSYLFVRIENGQFYFLQNTFGIAKVLMAAGHPATIERSIIRQLKKQENDHGVIVLPGQRPVKQPFNVGDSVKLKEGPMANCLGIVEGMSGNDRVRILMRLLGQQVPVQVGMTQLIAA